MSDIPRIGQSGHKTPSELEAMKPKDQATLAIWRKGCPAPIQILVEEAEALAVQEQFDKYQLVPGRCISFNSYNDGSGRRSKTIFVITDISAILVEYATLQLVTA